MKAYIFAITTLIALATNTLANANKDMPWSNEEIGAIPLEDGMDENVNPDEGTVLIVQKWKGMPGVMLMGGVKLSESYCTSGLRGTHPQREVKGNLVGPMRDGSGGNSIESTDCVIVRR